MSEEERVKQYNLLKEIVLLAYNERCDIKWFLNSFLDDDIFQRILLYSDIKYFNPYKTYSIFVGNHPTLRVEKQEIDDVVACYIIFIYLKFYYRTGESIRSIKKQLPIDNIINSYDKYHTLSEERVIFLSKVMYNLKMNPIRKTRIKDNPIFDYSSSRFNLFISKYIYLKLFDYPEIRSLQYRYQSGVEYLLSPDRSALMCSEYVNDYHEIELLSDPFLSHIKYDIPNNILFILTDNDDLLDENRLSILFNNQSDIPFDKILIYCNGKTLFVNGVNSLKRFYVHLTGLDSRKIDKDYHHHK